MAERAESSVGAAAAGGVRGDPSDARPDSNPPAVLLVTDGRADLVERTLRSVAKYLPAAAVHVWERSAAAPEDLPAAARPEVTRAVGGRAVGRVRALNTLAAGAVGQDLLVIEPGVELLGSLDAARAALSEAGTAVVALAALAGGAPDPAVRRWDAARRRGSVLRSLTRWAGHAERLRGRRVLGALSDLYPTPPATVEGHLSPGALLVARSAWDELGPFDERFLDEDPLWQLRARAAGWRLRMVDDPASMVRLTAGHPTADRHSTDLYRAGAVLALGSEAHRGAGTLFSAGTLLVERVMPAARSHRLEERGDLARRAAGRPSVVITTNSLLLGGAERQRVLLANELVERGHLVTLVCLKDLGPYLAELDPRVRLRLQPWWQPVVDGQGDEVLVSGVTNTEIGFAIGWRTFGRGRRWLAASHHPANLAGPTYSHAQALALRRADALLVLSRRHHTDLTRHQRLTDLVMVAPNGIPTAPARPYRPADSRSDGPVRFGMLTRLLEYKNPLLLIEALSALDERGRPGWTLDIFGDGPDRGWLEERTPAHLRDRVRWRGPSPGPDHAFAEIDVLCVPSGFEAFPLVMVEAMVRAVPVMASVSGAVPEMLDDGRAGTLVNPLTTERWTEALARVVDDPEGTAVLGAAGRVRALARYTAQAMVDDYERAFARVLGGDVAGRLADRHQHRDPDGGP